MAITLTPREQEILKLSSEGKTAEVIAQILGIKKRTIIFHRANIYSKFGVTTIVQACCKAVREGYIPAVLLVVTALVLIDGNDPELPYVAPTNVKPMKNMCTPEDFEWDDEALDEVCVEEGNSVSGVPVCKDEK